VPSKALQNLLGGFLKYQPDEPWMTENPFHSRMQRSQDEFIARHNCWRWPIFGAHPEIARSEDYGHPVAHLICGEQVPTCQAYFDVAAAPRMFSRKASR